MKTKIGNDVWIAKTFLEQGELVSIPTETVYGLAGNALNENAIAKIYEVKNRPRFNPLILHVGSISELRKYVLALPSPLEHIMDKFMPGPLTILLPKSSLVSDIVTAGSSKVAIRIPNHPLTLELLRNIDFPLVAPSANISGTVSPTSAKHVYLGLNSKIPYILDGGDCNIGLESTIIGWDEIVQKPILHRLGGLSIEEIEDYMGEKLIQNIQHTHPETPGQLKSHYATKTPLYLGNIIDLMPEFLNKKIVVINMQEEKPTSVLKQFILSKTNNQNEIAHNLFSIMRQADELNADVILCEYTENKGLGLAINDRLRRAQHILK